MTGGAGAARHRWWPGYRRRYRPLGRHQRLTRSLYQLPAEPSGRGSVVRAHRDNGGGRAIAVQAGDVADEGDVLRLFETVDAALGPLGALVNNAGILETQMRVEHMSAARLHHIFAVNVTGAFLCAREAIRRMSTGKRRRRRRHRQRLLGRVAAWLTW